MSVSGARAAPTLRLIESQCERGINKVQYGLVRDLVSWRLAAHKVVHRVDSGVHKVDNAAGVACLQSAHLPPMQLIIQSSRQCEEAYEETPSQITCIFFLNPFNLSCF